MMRLPYIIGEYGGQLNFDIYRYVQNIYVVYIYIRSHGTSFGAQFCQSSGQYSGSLKGACSLLDHCSEPYSYIV